MPSSKVKKVVLAVAGAAVGLVLVAAIIALVQGPAGRSSFNIKMASGGAAVAPLTGRTAMGLAAPGAPSYAESASVTADYAAPRPTMMPYPGQTGGQTAAEVDQKIIKSGSLRITVDSVFDSLGRITAIATARGGYVQGSSSTERADGTHDGEVTIRVPAKD
ncbi:MAG TPA: DUF4349 domain-containing protein, partial [Patescibacteria group bacterium]|nr:DUF4349 domain-containing protein [Patescibacteria group bacterium]